MDFDEFMQTMLKAFPNAIAGEDNDGQLVIYTNLRVLYPSDNPSIPEGESLVLDMDEIVTCDGCDATNLEGGWGDNPFCLDCSPADEICDEHQRTFADGECPLDHDE